MLAKLRKAEDRTLLLIGLKPSMWDVIRQGLKDSPGVVEGKKVMMW